MRLTLGDYLDLTVDDARRQWAGILTRPAAAPGKPQVAFVPVETLCCLAAMFVVDHSRYTSAAAKRAPAPVPQLARLFRRPPTSIIAKMDNVEGLRPNGARWDRSVGAALSNDPARLTELYRVLMAGARAAGVTAAALPDFLGLEAGGDLHLLGQDELDVDAIAESVVEDAYADFVAGRPIGSARLTEQLVLAKARVGQHRFARDVLHNCGRECVFCGFSLAPTSDAGLLRASHVKPWRVSEAKERLDVTNGLAACPTHDAAFDAGLLTVESDLTVVVSPRLRAAAATSPGVHQVLREPPFRRSLTDARIAVPPGETYLAWHRREVYAA